MATEKEKFDYDKALAELESMAAAVEDPATRIEDIDRYVKRAKELISSCRGYLRSVRDKADELDESDA